MQERELANKSPAVCNSKIKVYTWKIIIYLPFFHIKHKTKGYHYFGNLIRNETGRVFSDSLAHKYCKLTGIRSKINRERKVAGKNILNLLTQLKKIGIQQNLLK